MPYEVPLMFNAQIRNVLPTADHAGLCLGLQIVGLEASEDGRQTLSRLAKVVDRYHQINQSEGRVPQTTVQAASPLFHVPCDAQ
jgi:imidazoleglycerol phosphate synthase glutamine amidotransferase subunit HisH